MTSVKHEQIPLEWGTYKALAIEHFLAEIIRGIQRCWVAISPPAPNEHENPITQRLSFQLCNDHGLRQLSVKVFSQPQNVQSGDGKVYTQIDLHFQHLVTHGNDDFIWFECKRLCCHSKSGQKATFYGAGYVDGDNQGMTAFVSGRYDCPRGHAGMLGYILCPPPSGDILRSLETSIDDQKVLLELGNSPHLTECAHALGQTLVRTTWHRSRSLQIHHVLLVAPGATASLPRVLKAKRALKARPAPQAQRK